MINIYREKIKELIEKRMLHDPYTNIVVRMMAERYLKDMEQDKNRGVLEKILNNSFDEFMFNLFSIHFKAYDDLALSNLNMHQKGLKQVIVVDKETFENMKAESNLYRELKKERDDLDSIEKERQKLYKEIRAENYGRNVL